MYLRASLTYIYLTLSQFRGRDGVLAQCLSDYLGYKIRRTEVLQKRKYENVSVT